MAAMTMYETYRANIAAQERAADVAQLTANMDAATAMHEAWAMFQSVASAALANVIRATATYHETRGVSAPAALDEATSAIERSAEDHFLRLMCAAYDSITR